MGSISRNSTGSVTVIYNRTHLDELDEQVIRYAIASFSHLVQRNQKLCFTEFHELIQQHYAAEGKTKLSLEVLQKAAIKNRYFCNFKYQNQQTGLIEYGEAVVEVEQWSQVKPELERKVNTEVMELDFKGVSCVYRKGSFNYDVQRQEVQL